MIFPLPPIEEVKKNLDTFFNEYCILDVQLSIKDNILHVTFGNYIVTYDSEGQARDNEMIVFVDKAWKKNYTANVVSGIIAAQITYKIIQHLATK